ncbi:Uncharacterised protein [Chlamydia abortus]|nr:Uncharacterised protein [Chlamydia abortus]
MFLIFHEFQFSCHIPRPTVDISKFSTFSVFLAIFHVLNMYFSFSVIFSFLAILQVLQCAFLIVIFSFLAIFQVLQCAFLIIHVF